MTRLAMRSMKNLQLRKFQRSETHETHEFSIIQPPTIFPPFHYVAIIRRTNVCANCNPDFHFHPANLSKTPNDPIISEENSIFRRNQR